MFASTVIEFPPTVWATFIGFVLFMLALDLGVFHRKSHTVSFKEALSWTGVWVTLSSIFGAWIWNTYGQQKGLEFFTGYLIELSLSADNVFVFVLIFSYFAVPQQYQHKVLFWGILSALVLRFIMIWLGATLVAKFAWIIYIFGAFLIFSGLKMLFKSDEEEDPANNPLVKWFRRAVPSVEEYHGDKFFIKRDGRWLATPLLVVLFTIEISDVIFAVDSIPAIFAVTKDPFLVFTSNVFAILGLRSLYFVLGGLVQKFHLLKAGLGLVLSFVGVKMLLGHTAYKIPTAIALCVVVTIIAGSIIASLLFPKKHPHPPLQAATDAPEADPTHLPSPTPPPPSGPPPM